MHWLKISRIVFAVTMIAMGLIGLFGAGRWQPVPMGVAGHQALNVIYIAVALVSGVGLLFVRTASWAAALLLLRLLAWTALFKIPIVVRAPLVEVSYQNLGEALVPIAAAWILIGSSAEVRRRGIFALFAGEGGRRIAYVLYGLALIAFGFSHIAYLNLTAPLVPAWLPGHVFWAYLTGTLYVATGLSLVTGFASRAGALVAAAQITLITVLVWGPMVVAGNLSPTNLQETIVSWELTAAAWVVAASFEVSRRVKGTDPKRWAWRRLAAAR